MRAQVSLAVIDEAVYGVKPDDTPDPIRFFYRREYSRVGTTFSSSYYFTGYSGRDRLQLAAAQAPPVHARRLQGRSSRRRRRCARIFPTRSTGSAISSPMRTGKGRIAVTYPDALTTWRLTARAVTDDTRAGIDRSRARRRPRI